jgi:hypothetical protein
MERIQTYYSALGVRTLFEHHPELEEHLMKGKDDRLVAAVGPSANHTTLPALTASAMTPSQISNAAANQRSIHTSHLQQDVLLYLQPSGKDGLGHNIPSSLSREEQGLGCHLTARFLVPRQHLDAFETDPDRSVLPHQRIHT